MNRKKKIQKHYHKVKEWECQNSNSVNFKKDFKPKKRKKSNNKNSNNKKKRNLNKTKKSKKEKENKKKNSFQKIM
jgi:hypothetical protein